MQGVERPEPPLQMRLQRPHHQVVHLGHHRGPSLVERGPTARRACPAAPPPRPGSAPGPGGGPRSATRPPPAPMTPAASLPHATQTSTWGRKPSSASALRKNPGTTSGASWSDSVRSAPTSISYSRRLGWRSRASWSAASSMDTARASRSRSSRSGRKWSIVSACDTMSSSPRPSYSSSSTWPGGSSRPPKRLLVLRTPLATARTLPWSRVRKDTMRSASPSLCVRSTTPRSW